MQTVFLLTIFTIFYIPSMTMCKRSCQMYGGCNHVSYDKNHLVCTLLSLSEHATELGFLTTSVNGQSTSFKHLYRNLKTVHCGSNTCSSFETCVHFSHTEPVCVRTGQRACNESKFIMSSAESGKDYQVQWSSVYAVGDTDKYHLNSATCWAPYRRDDQQWIQVLFNTTRLIKGIAMQNRRQKNQWVTAFRVYYKGSDCDSWLSVLDENLQPKEFEGVKDDGKIYERFLPKPVHARRVYVNPTKFIGHISLRFDIIGC